MEWPKVDLGRQLERLRGLTGGVWDGTKEAATEVGERAVNTGTELSDGTKRTAGDVLLDGLLLVTPDDWFTVYGSGAADAEALEPDPRR